MRILLADDHALFRAGLTSLLEAWGHEVVGEAANGFEALEIARRLRPEVILMDINMPECSGLEATRLIKAELTDVRIVIVSVSDKDADLFEAVKSGAEGYLLKDMSEHELEHTLQAVAAGDPALLPGLASKILAEYSRLAREGPAIDPSTLLTRRESEVLELLAEGLTNREIAAKLFVSENTVGFHVKNIFAKLHLRNRSEAVAFAIRSGLAQLPPE
jgi:DNA-binding NarL/FixJ family response regulator